MRIFFLVFLVWVCVSSEAHSQFLKSASVNTHRSFYGNREAKRVSPHTLSILKMANRPKSAVIYSKDNQHDWYLSGSQRYVYSNALLPDSILTTDTLGKITEWHAYKYDSLNNLTQDIRYKEYMYSTVHDSTFYTYRFVNDSTLTNYSITKHDIGHYYKYDFQLFYDSTLGLDSLYQNYSSDREPSAYYKSIVSYFKNGESRSNLYYRDSTNKPWILYYSNLVKGIYQPVKFDYHFLIPQRPLDLLDYKLLPSLGNSTGVQRNYSTSLMDSVKATQYDTDTSKYSVQWKKTNGVWRKVYGYYSAIDSVMLVKKHQYISYSSNDSSLDQYNKYYYYFDANNYLSEYIILDAHWLGHENYTKYVYSNILPNKAERPAKSVQISSNPVAERLTLQNLNNLSRFNIRNLHGQTVWSGEVIPQDGKASISVEALPPGMYSLQLPEKTLRFVKE